MQLNFSTAPSGNQPTVFTFDKMDVRVIRKDGEPWFVASDVCEALTIGNSRDAVGRLDDDEKGVGTIDTLGGAQEQAIINESGLYSLILTSRKSAAKRFKKWVTAEVLPSIRKTGSYTVGQPQPPVALPDFTNPAIAARAWAEQFEAKAQAQQQLALAAPKVAFVDRYVESTGNKCFRTVAKLLGAKEPALRAFLQYRGVMYMLDGEWMAYSQHHAAGRFVVKTGSRNGHSFAQTLFTPKGVQWIAGQWAKHQLPETETMF